MIDSTSAPRNARETLCAESVSKRRLPQNLSEADREIFSHELIKRIPPCRLLEFRGVNITPDGLLFRNGAVLPESFAHPNEADHWKSLRSRLRLYASGFRAARRHAIAGDAYWITDTQSAEFFHWMADALPRLLSIRDRIKTGTLLLPACYAGITYVTESLKAFEVWQIRFVERMTRCRNLFIPTHAAPSGNFNDALMRQLRDQFRTHFGSIPTPAVSNRLYISRARAPKRKIHNEDAIIEVLENHDFHAVHLEEYPFDRQVAIAMHTRFLVSNHGAGLTNMIFMPAGSCVLEMRKQDDCHNNCYFSLASALGIRYFYQICPARVEDEDSFSADLIVSPEMLRANLDHMLTH
ncbi:MAG TPA: glycosyltransferase family 61 protein [Opitutaceae bacterium]